MHKSNWRDTSSTKEESVEDYLVERVQRVGGFAIKLDPKNAVGIPDRLVILPGHVVFVETKRPVGGRMRGAQTFWRNMLLKFGLNWRRINTRAQVDEFICEFA